MVIKFLHVILLASVKYVVTLPYAMIIGMEYPQALVAVLLGGIGGFLFFYYLSKRVIRVFNHNCPKFSSLVPAVFRQRYRAFCENRKARRKPGKIFSRKNRLIARLRANYGFWGIILTTPILLSIPLGAFLANKYYSRRRHIVLYMILSIIGWAGVFSGLVHLFPKIFF